MTSEDEKLVKKMIKREMRGPGCIYYIPLIVPAIIACYNPEPLRQAVKSIIQWALK